MAETMKIAIDPRKNFKEASTVIKVLYVALAAVSLLWLISEFFNPTILHGVVLLILSFPLAYLIIDSGLVILRGRNVGYSLGFIWSILAIGDAVVTLIGVNAQPALNTAFVAAAGVAGLVVFVCLLLPQTRAHFKAHRAVDPAKKKEAQRTAKANPNAPIAGSFADIMAKEKAAKDKA